MTREMSAGFSSVWRVNDQPSGSQPSTTVADTDARRSRLIPLSAQYEAEQHQPYVELILEALSPENAVIPHNIAVTGHYGSGKSSVLAELERRLGSRAMNLALSSLGTDATKLGRVDEQGKPPALTNLIQKEIVKQLLYRERPAKMRGSHYPRIDQFRILPALGWSMTILVITAVAGVLTGLPAKVLEVLPTTLTSGFDWLPWATVAFVSLLAGGLAYGLQRTFHGRLRIEKLSAGPAAVALTNAGNTYFDEYLDEIVFYFQRSRVEVAVFEDLDRFNDPHIFETLRELNTVLNNSKQIRRKPITFIYAIRDSVFQLLDDDSSRAGQTKAQTTPPDEAGPSGNAASTEDETTPEDVKTAIQSPVTSRTKFFDLVVPLVPFLSHRTARGLLRDVCRELADPPQKAVMDLVAPYLTDMRLIKNIRNEYQVFASRVLPPHGRPHLDPDKLFAMIVYKNVQMQDFEDIREGNGRLDRIYRAYRALVTYQATECDDAIRAARTHLANLGSTVPRAHRYAARLEAVLKALAPTLGYGWQGRSTYVNAGGVSFALEDLRKPEFWTTVVTGGSILLPQWSNRSIDTQALSTLLGLSLDPADWLEERRSSFDEIVRRSEQLKEFVTHASIQELVAHADVTMPYPKPGSAVRSLAEIADEELVPVAFDLLEAGYIDQNYTLYIADFAGVSVSTSAMNFILQAVQPDRADIHYKFASTADIDAVVQEEGNRFLHGLSVRNIEAFDHLLATAPSQLRRCLVRLGAEPIPEANVFMDAYIAAGKHPDLMIEHLAPVCRRVFSYTTALQGQPSDQAARLVNAAFKGADPGVEYEADDRVRAEIGDLYSRLPVFTSPEYGTHASVIGQLAEDLGVMFDDLSALAVPQRDEAVRRHLYPISLSNLRTIVGTDAHLSLDMMKETRAAVYKHSLANLDDYLAALVEADLPSVLSTEGFIDVLTDVHQIEPESVARVAKAAASGCVIQDLRDVDVAIWPALAGSERFAATASNAIAYVNAHGVDEAFAHFIGTRTDFTEPAASEPTDRVHLAVALANARNLEASVKVRLVKSLRLPAALAPEDLSGDGLEALPDFVDEGVVKDGVNAYNRIADKPWPIRERLLAVSDAAQYVSALPLSREDILHIFTSGIVPDRLRVAVCDNLSLFVNIVGAAEASAICAWAASQQYAFGSEHLACLSTAGASTDEVLSALAVAVGDLELAAIEVVSGQLGEPFNELTRIGDRRAKTVPATNATQTLLERLQQLGTVSSFRRTGLNGDLFEVRMKLVPFQP